MNIAIFSDNFYPEISGIADSIVMTGRELVRRGHSVMFVAPRYSEESYKKTGTPSKEHDELEQMTLRLPSIPYPGSPTGESRIAIPVGSAIPALRKFRPDIIYSQLPFGTGLEALLDAKILGVPFVGTNHTPIAEFMPPFLKKTGSFGAWATDMTVRYFSWYYNRCTFVSAPCNALLEDMSRHGFRRNKIPNEAIANPVNFSAVFSAVNTTNTEKNSSDSGKTDLKKRFNFSPHTVFYTGRLAPEKHVDVIIRAIALAKADIPDITLAITGYGSAEKDLRRLADDLGVADRVRFLGFVDPETFTLLYRASDIFVIMSTAETQSLSLMLAMANGMPVIGARAWGLPEYITEGNGYILEPGDDKGLANMLTDLFKNPARMAEFGKNGVEAVHNYTPAMIAAKWETVFNAVLQKKLQK